MLRAFENVVMEDNDALCNGLQAMRIMANVHTPHGELVVRQKRTKSHSDQTRLTTIGQRTKLPSYSSSYSPYGETSYQDLLAEHLDANAATLSTVR